MSDSKTHSDFDAAHARICELIERFHGHAAAYLQPSYQEAEARKDFIDPMLKALGWDVDHEREHNPYEQEVKVERGVSVNNARAQKRADYAFYLAPNYRDVRFFVEAKKPSVDLVRSVDAHFQTLRYGYSANTPLAVLTDFEQIRVLDCRRRPHPDTALEQAYKSWHYTDFRDPARFAEFYWLFSREAHANGSYQRHIDSLPKPKGGARQRGLFKGGYQSVDVSFLAELEEHRTALAKAFKKADLGLNSDTLTEIVQRTLDRLVFLRFLEDKQIETEIRLSDFGKGKGAWADFQAASRRLDNIYNGIVFKRLPPLDDTGFEVSDDVFADVCERLSAENSPYNFDAIPIHILGSIYERFLGSVIRTTAQRVFVEEKPEVRKAGGVYYTPEYIVRYIVAQTVGKQIAGKSPAEISGLRFADIACGSGSFLLGIFDELIRYHAEWYNRAENEKQARKDGCVQTEDGLWRLSLAQRRAILQNNVYGVDIDRQAVEVAQLSLFLKLLEDERATSTRQYQLDYGRDAGLKKLLPDLGGNIVCGNSLIGWDVAGLAGLDADDERKLNPLDFEQAFPAVMRSGGFDAVVGNPPYVDSEWMSKHSPVVRASCTQLYKSASGNWDLFCVFVERTLLLCKKNGIASLILPNKLGSAGYAKGAREVLAEHSIISIRDYSSVAVFPVSVYPIVYVAKRAPSDSDATVYYEHMVVTPTGEVVIDDEKLLGLSAYFMPPEKPWRIFTNTDENNPSQRILANNAALGSVAQVVGAATVTEAYEIAPLISESDAGLRVVNSGTIDPYSLMWGKKQFRYLGRTFIKPVISEKELAELPKKRLQQAKTPKLIFAGMTKRLECGVDIEGIYLAGKSTSLVFWDGDLRYMAALLNSKLINFIYNTQYGGDKLQGGYLRIGPPQLKNIPVRMIDISRHEDVALRDRTITLVDQMLVAKQQEAAANGQAKEIAARKCAALDRQIDALVYELYGLSPDEIALVEGHA